MNTRRFNIGKAAMLFLLAGVFALASCFNPMAGKETVGRFVIGASSSRAFFDNTNSDKIAKLSLEITVSDGPGPEQKKTARGSESVPFTVIPGKWTISVRAYLDDSLAAYGSKTMAIKAGDNNVEIAMHTIGAGLYWVSGGNYSRVESVPPNDVERAVNHVNGKPGTYILFMESGSVSVGTQTLRAGNLSLMGIQPTTIQLSATGSLFTVNSGASLTLDSNIILTGQSSPSTNETALIKINSNGMFTMKGNSVVRDNTHNSLGTGFGGGVLISGGTFTMKDNSLIYGNAVENDGGGVYVDGGTFIMQGGTISNSMALRDGGAVAVVNSGTFTMTGGTISGNEVAGKGGGVYVNGGTFAKTGSSTIYGQVNTPPVDPDNSATEGNAVYVAAYGSITQKQLDGTSGWGHNLYSNIDGQPGGWVSGGGGPGPGNSFKVTFNSNGGSSVADLTVNGGRITEPVAPVKIGYLACKFDRWYKDPGLTDDWDFTTDTVTGNMTLYAKWDEWTVGQTGPGGGIVFYKALSDGSGFYIEATSIRACYLEAAPEDISVPMSWSSAEATNTLIPGTATNIGRGYANTVAILARDTGSGGPPAAKACDTYEEPITHINNWFLPSKDELYKIYEQKEHFPNLKAGGLYWSSTEYNNSGFLVWVQNLSTGQQQSNVKTDATLYVRPIRAF